MSWSQLGAWSNYRLGLTLAMDCLAPYEKALLLATIDLQQDMEAAERYDHEKPKGDYAKKNEYFNRANNLCMPFLEKGVTGLSKMYYWRMLNTISDHEKKHSKPLNKGMVCGNLGVSALAEGDIDGGIAHLLWAGQEDRAWAGDPTKNIFANPLYTQFAEGTHRQGRSQFGLEAPWNMLKTAVHEYNTEFKDTVDIDDVLKELDGFSEHRALLEGSLWVIHRNVALLKEEKELGIYSDKNNIYTRLRLFDGVIGLCRFVELRMRHHEKTLGTLGDLLKSIFEREPWWKNDVTPRSSRRPQTPQDFDNAVMEALTKCSRPARNVFVLWAVRNYATHVCDPDTRYFFEKLDNVVCEIVAAYIYYLRFRKLI